MDTQKKDTSQKDVKGEEVLDLPIQPIEDADKERRILYIILGLALFVLVAGGIGTGYLLSKPTSGTMESNTASGSGQMLGKGFGSSDTKTFSDTTTGVVEKDGTEGEGTHKLVREGGPSQTACLVSSVLDLDEFAGKKVKVWSKTMAAKKCAWLMDVGRVEPQ